MHLHWLDIYVFTSKLLWRNFVYILKLRSIIQIHSSVFIVLCPFEITLLIKCHSLGIEHPWNHIICRNAHIVYQNYMYICFIIYPKLDDSTWNDILWTPCDDLKEDGFKCNSSWILKRLWWTWLCYISSYCFEKTHFGISAILHMANTKYLRYRRCQNVLTSFRLLLYNGSSWNDVYNFLILF